MNKMLIPLTKAPFNQPLILVRIKNENFADRLQRIGLFEQSEIVRLDENLQIQSVRIRGAKGDAIMGGGMGLKTIIHLDDGRKLPLLDMKPGESGHLEGITCGDALAHTLEVLGFSLDDPITMIRKLPPMEYIAITEFGLRIRLSEGDAAKLWGVVDNRHTQFSLAPTGKKFEVTKILGGKRSRKKIKNLCVNPSSILTLEGVEQAQFLHLGAGVKSDVVITSHDGLHLHLPHREGERILVAVK